MPDSKEYETFLKKVKGKKPPTEAYEPQLGLPPAREEEPKWWQTFLAKLFQTRPSPLSASAAEMMGGLREFQKFTGGLISQPFVKELGGMGKTTLSPETFMAGGKGREIYEKVVPGPAKAVAEEAILAPTYLMGGAKAATTGLARLSELVSGRAATAEAKIAAGVLPNKAERIALDALQRATEFGAKDLGQISSADLLKAAYGAVKVGGKPVTTEAALKAARASAQAGMKAATEKTVKEAKLPPGVATHLETARRIREAVAFIDKHSLEEIQKSYYARTKELAYREALGPPTGTMLKRGETWRLKALKSADLMEQMAARIQVEATEKATQVAKEVPTPGAFAEKATQAAKEAVIDDSKFVVQKPNFIREPTVMPILKDGRKIGSVEIELPEPYEIVVHQIKVDVPGTLNKTLLRETMDAIESFATNHGASKVRIISRKQAKAMYEAAGYTFNEASQTFEKRIVFPTIAGAEKVSKAIVERPKLTADLWSGMKPRDQLTFVNRAGLGRDIVGQIWSSLPKKVQKPLSRIYAGDDPAIVKLERLIIEDVKPFRIQAEEAYKQALKPKVARYAAARTKGLAEGMKPSEIQAASKAQLTGKMEEFTGDTLARHLTDPEIEALKAHVLKANLLPFNEARMFETLDDMLYKNILPEPAELLRMQEVFGDGIIKAIMSNRPLSQKLMDATFDVLNLPRAFLASFDLSAPLRQGLVLLPGHPKASYEAFKWQLKALTSETNAKVLNDLLLGKGADLDPIWKAAAERRISAGLFLHDVGSPIAAREEAFISNLARRIPGIKMSERAYTTYLNKLRVDVFDSIVSGWERSGKAITHLDEQELARFINRATGRGELWFGEYGRRAVATPYGGLGNFLFFSPRLQTSRLLLPLSLGSKSPAVRRMALKDLSIFVGTATTVLGLVALHPDVTVETDYRSTDAGKMRVGNTRLDLSAGFNPYIRMFWRMAAGEKLSVSGRPIPRRSSDELLQTIRQKFSPIVGQLYDYATGTTYSGDPFWWQTGDKQALIEQSIDAFVPMAPQSIYQTIQEEGLDPAALGLASVEFFGGGVTSYDSSMSTAGEVRTLVGYYEAKQRQARDLLEQSKSAALKKFATENKDAGFVYDAKQETVVSRMLADYREAARIVDKVEEQIQTIKNSDLPYADKNDQVKELERKLAEFCSTILITLEYKYK